MPPLFTRATSASTEPRSVGELGCSQCTTLACPMLSRAPQRLLWRPLTRSLFGRLPHASFARDAGNCHQSKLARFGEGSV